MNPRQLLSQAWSVLRRASGDDAYERYLAHWRERHSEEGAPLERKAFYHTELERKWSGVRRCC